MRGQTASSTVGTFPLEPETSKWRCRLTGGGSELDVHFSLCCGVSTDCQCRLPTALHGLGSSWPTARALSATRDHCTMLPSFLFVSPFFGPRYERNVVLWSFAAGCADSLSGFKGRDSPGGGRAWGTAPAARTTEPLAGVGGPPHPHHPPHPRHRTSCEDTLLISISCCCCCCRLTRLGTFRAPRTLPD